MLCPFVVNKPITEARNIRADTDSQLESLAAPEIPSENPSSLSSQENSSVTQKAQVNLEPTSSRESETALLLKENQRTNEVVSD